MPKQFEDCVKAGGRVRTKELSGGRYLHICYPKGGGKAVTGEVKTKKKSSPAGRIYGKKGQE